MSKRKRNVNAESHLLTGGLITGFLTFMGFLPGAAASAAITGSLVREDIKKAQKQEAFKRDFDLHMESTEKGRAEAMKEITRIKKILEDLLYDFDPNSEKLRAQEEFENVFQGAKVTNIYRSTPSDRVQVSQGKIMKLAKTTDSSNKIVVLDYRGKATEYVIKTENREVYCQTYEYFPYNFRKTCEYWNVPFRKLEQKEYDKEIVRIAQIIYAPYQFDYSKYR